jgi:hypothetical protein
MDNFQNNLFLNIQFTITEAINEYSKIIASNYNIDPEALKDLWKDVSSNIEFSTLKRDDNLSIVSSSSSSYSRKSKSPIKEVSDTTTGEVDSNCCYKLTRGPKKGEMCDKPKKFGDYCVQHKKYNNDDSSSVAISVKSSSEEGPVKKSVEKVIRKNKELDKFWHAETKMVFKSKTERVVIGIEDNCNILPLSKEDKLVCEKYGFRYINEEGVEEEKSVE